METKEILLIGLKQWNIDLDGDTYEKFNMYKDILKQWNEKMNLTTIIDDDEIMVKHFIDSLSIIKAVDLKKKLKIIDVGTGAGFPGLPIKIAYPNIDMVLMDSLKKRIHFLDEVISQLQLTGIECVHMGAEYGGRDINYREQFDVACSRAVAKLSVLAEYCLPYVKMNGVFVAMKGPNCEEEVKDAENIIYSLGGKIIDILYVLLPNSDITHTLIVIKRIRHTPHKYPRNKGQMLKSNKKTVEIDKKTN